MASGDPFFKIRPTKRSNPEARTTLDSIHHSHLSKLLDESENVEALESHLLGLKESIKTCKDDIEKVKLEKEFQDLLKEYKKRKSGSAVYDYYLETGNILYQYYDIQDKINRGVESKVNRPAKSKPGSIFAILEQAANEAPTDHDISGTSMYSETNGGSGKERGEDMRREKLLETYLQKIDPTHARASQNIHNDPYGECEECLTEMFFSANEALFTCPTCGFQEFILVDSDKPSYKDPPREVSYYAYKRINHFNEWLAQFQAKESTEIPEEVFEAILNQIKKERLQASSLNRTKIREILKKLKFNSYYEHVPHILSRLNGHTAPVMDRETEEKLRYLFKEIQPSFQKHCPADRSNFLSYSYVLYKLCELLELDRFLHCFPLLKNRDKLYAQDKIWEKICKDLQWEFYRSI